MSAKESTPSSAFASDMEEQNVTGLVRHFQKGCKLNCIQKLGLEVEHFIVHSDTGKSVDYYETHGIGELLRILSEDFPHLYYDEGKLIGLWNNDYSITLEPAAQIEVSIGARENIHSIFLIYQSFVRLITPFLHAHGYRLVTLGYHPVSSISELPLIPKQRYEFMDRYFQKVDSHGRNMMRGTASAQISIDYCCESDFIRKFRAAYILMPAMKLLTDNTPFFEGTAYPSHMARTLIWNHVDPDRCGIVPGLFSDDFGFLAYAKYIWNMPLIFRPTEDLPVYTDGTPVAEIWKDTALSESDIDHVLSMVFPDVRLKHYIEIRGADCMPIEFVMSYLAFIKGIFFHKEPLVHLLNRYHFVTEQDIADADRSLMQNGYNGFVYGVPVFDFLKELFEIAEKNLDTAEAVYLHPLRSLFETKTTLAENYRSICDPDTHLIPDEDAAEQILKNAHNL